MTDVVDNLGVENNEAQQAPDVDNPQVTSQDSGDAVKERYKQQIEGSKQEAGRLRGIAIDNAYKAAQYDANSLLELHAQDPKVANEVAKKFGYDSFDDAKSSIEGNKPKEEKSSLSEEDFNRMYEQRRGKEVHSESLKKADKVIKKLEGGDQEAAQSYFDKITEGKTLNESSAIEFAEMATLYVSRGKLQGEALSDGLAAMHSTGLSQSKKVEKSKGKSEGYVIVDGQLVLQSNNQS